MVSSTLLPVARNPKASMRARPSCSCCRRRAAVIGPVASRHAAGVRSAATALAASTALRISAVVGTSPACCFALSIAAAAIKFEHAASCPWHKCALSDLHNTSGEEAATQEASESTEVASPSRSEESAQTVEIASSSATTSLTSWSTSSCVLQPCQASQLECGCNRRTMPCVLSGSSTHLTPSSVPVDATSTFAMTGQPSSVMVW
mmetsp:Transcript_1015/g.1887  ORF Transcript_1015/g.1887 Transcript_1015/m.1887 type:complete len:205 (-) Transcript_1015:132-746(-)